MSENSTKRPGLSSTTGVTPTYLRHANRGMAAVQQTIQYRKELMAGDVLRVESQLLDMRDKVVRFVHTMMNVEDETPAAICELTGVHMDTVMRKSTPFPPAIGKKRRR